MGTAIDIIKGKEERELRRQGMEERGEIKKYEVDDKVREEFRATFGKTVAFLDMIGVREKLEEILGDIEVADSPATISKLKGKLDVIMKYVNVFKAASDSINRTEKTIIKEERGEETESVMSGDTGNIEIIEKIDYDTIAGAVKR
nr:MAG TPA: hypothetical protein [Caudoviricetes sp.]